MSLPARPTLIEIKNQFATNTRNGLSKLSLREFYIAVFGSVVSGTSRQSDFGGTGLPSSDTLSPQAVDTDSANIRGNVGNGNVPCDYFFEWGAGNYNNSTTPKSVTTDALVSETITGLSNNTQYQYRLVTFNGFNSNSVDYIRSGTQTFTTGATVDTSRPYNLSISQTKFTAPLEAEGTWELLDTTRGLQIQWELNGSFEKNVTLSAGTVSYTSGGYSGNDQVRFRVRYTSGGNTSFSDWSATATLLETA